MLPHKRWLDDNLGKIGFVLFAFGSILLVLGMAGIVLQMVMRYPGFVASGNSVSDWSQTLMMIASLHYGFGTTLTVIGVAFYCLGRLIENSFVTIVGFERTPPSKLLVKGPDENNVVWIGSPYDSPIDAQLAAQAFAARLGSSAGSVP
ncbi:MAG TPA: hypothetical protein VGL83_10035 [Stellaceae bacterium]|jgi:hypothetical protein